MNKTALLLLAVILTGVTACGGNVEASVTRPTGPSTSSSAPSQHAEESPGPSTSEGGLPLSEEATAVPAGTHELPRDAWASTAGYTVTIPEGWLVQYGHMFSKPTGPGSEGVGFYAQTVDEILTEPCNGGGRSRRVGPGVDTLVDALLEQPGPVYSRPIRTTLGGHRAIRLDVTSPRQADQCPNVADGYGVRLWNSGAAGNLLLTTGETDSLYVMDFPRGRLVFVTSDNQAPAGARSELKRIMSSLTFEG